MKKILGFLCVLGACCAGVFATPSNKISIQDRASSEERQRFDSDYALLNEKLMDLLGAAKYGQLKWQEVGGMQVLMEPSGPATLKIPGSDAVAFVMVLDPKQAASNATCSYDNVMATQQFWNSAYNNNDDSLNYWHSSYPGLNVNYIPEVDDDDGNDSSLCCASKNNNTEMVQEIIGWGGSPLPTCRHGYTALCYAAQNGNANMTRSLVKAGAVVNVDCKGKDDDAGTPLCQASEVNSTPTAGVLLAGNATVNTVCDENSALCWATFYNNTVLSLAYIDRDAEVNAFCGHYSQDSNLQVTGDPICYAVILNNMDTAEALLEAGADPNVECNDYRSISKTVAKPICYASQAMADLLKSYGATDCNSN